MTRSNELYLVVQAQYFPTSLKDAKRVLSESPLVRAKANVIRDFVLGITSKVLKGEIGIGEMTKRLAAIRATSEMHRDYFLSLIQTHFPNVFQKTADNGLRYLLTILWRIPETLDAVTDGLEARIKQYLELAPLADLPIVIHAGLAISIFRDSTLKRLATLDEDSLAKVIGAGRPPKDVIEKALSDYEASGNFAKANAFGKKVIQPLLGELDKSQVLRLFEIGERNGEVRDSFAFNEIMQEIKASGIHTAAEFRSEAQRRGWDQLVDELEPPHDEPEPEKPK